MKKSTQNTCCFLIVALIIGVITVALAYCGMLPCIAYTANMALCFTAVLMLALFALASISSCHCTRKLALALCRYGGCLAIALLVALLAGFLVVTLPAIEAEIVCYLIALFIQTVAFTFALMLLTAVIYTMATLGCPRCRTTIKRTCDDDEDLDAFKL